jgi:small subunit ribosomal protein S21
VIKVTIRQGEPPERFLQRFKRICSKEGVFKEVKRRRYFEKPSERRRRRAKESVRQAKKEARRAAIRARAR